MSTHTVQIDTIVVTPFQQNARILHSGSGSAAVLVDPGGEPQRLLDHLDKNNLTLEAIWLTHSHLDHCGGVAGVLRKFPVPLFGHKIEREMRARVVDICALYGMPVADMENCPEPDHYIDEGDVVTVAGHTFTVLFTPGHSPGHICFYSAEQGVLLAGDTVFSGSIGRTDLPGGDQQTLFESIERKILSLSDQTRILSGHGPDTTVGRERMSNPWLQAFSS